MAAADDNYTHFSAFFADNLRGALNGSVQGHT
jgi:hypothetical protein